MPLIDDISAELKKQPGKHYRFVRKESGNVSVKKARGYEMVSSQDPEVKGTILEQHKDGDSHVAVGNLVLMRCTEEQYQKNRKKIDDRSEAIRNAVKQRYEAGGEELKRKLGKKHSGLTLIHEESD